MRQASYKVYLFYKKKKFKETSHFVTKNVIVNENRQIWKFIKDACCIVTVSMFQIFFMQSTSKNLSFFLRQSLQIKRSTYFGLHTDICWHWTSASSLLVIKYLQYSVINFILKMLRGDGYTALHTVIMDCAESRQKFGTEFHDYLILFLFQLYQTPFNSNLLRY